MRFGRLFQQLVRSTRHSARNAGELLHALRAELRSNRRPPRCIVPVDVGRATDLCELRTLLSGMAPVPESPVPESPVAESPVSESPVFPIDEFSPPVAGGASAVERPWHPVTGAVDSGISANPSVGVAGAQTGERTAGARNGDDETKLAPAASPDDLNAETDAYFGGATAVLTGDFRDDLNAGTFSVAMLPGDGLSDADRVPVLESPVVDFNSLPESVLLPDVVTRSQQVPAENPPQPIRSSEQSANFHLQPSELLRVPGSDRSASVQAAGASPQRDRVQFLFPRDANAIHSAGSLAGRSRWTDRETSLGAVSIANCVRSPAGVRSSPRQTAAGTVMVSANGPVFRDVDLARAGTDASGQSPLTGAGGRPAPAIEGPAVGRRSAAHADRIADRENRNLRIGIRDLRCDVLTDGPVEAGEGPPYQAEFTAPERQLRYQLQPRAPPAGAGAGSLASGVIGQDVQSDVLKRLRFSIAPRGPSLDAAICAESVSDTLRS